MYIKRLNDSLYGVYRGNEQKCIGTWRECYLYAEGFGKDNAAELRYECRKKGDRMDINATAKRCYDIAMMRAQKMQAPYPDDTQKMLKHCAGEVVESMDALNKWQEGNLSRRDYGEELADMKKRFLIEYKRIILGLVAKQ